MSGTTALQRQLGGEAGHRSFFGGVQSRGRIIGLGSAFVLGLVLTPLMGWPAIAIAATIAGVTMLLTARTHRGTIADRARARRRWRMRRTDGTDIFVPYSVATWDQALEAHAQAERRRERKAAALDLAAIRANPDGADGLGWLESAIGAPGIAWHAPIGEQPYLSVAFAMEGQHRGIDSISAMNRATESWGQFLASRAAAGSLARRVQTLTRVVPADTALQEFWTMANIDPAAPVEAVMSYEQVLRRTGAGAMVQRHFVIVSWPITATFESEARRYGNGRDGWRALMAHEIDSVQRGLFDARMGTVEPLSARRVTALMLHQQNPNRPVDQVVDVDPATTGIASMDEFSAHVVYGVDEHGEPVQWWHRTARIEAHALTNAPRGSLWALGLLVGRELQFVRSISFHMSLVPASAARAAAIRDVTRDQAEVLAKTKKGRVDVDGTVATMSAARSRTDDLVAGSGHHGVSWVGYVTVSARRRDELARNCRQLEEAASTEAGIEHLLWMDSYQAAASGTTWPLGRGIQSTSSITDRLYGVLAGRANKEELA